MMLTINSNLRKYFKNHVYPVSIIMFFIFMKGKYSLSYREIEEIGRLCGLEIDHSTLQRWVVKFMPLLELQFRKRKKPVNGSWRMDETYIKVKGKWVYLYRVVDSCGNTIDFLLRAKRDETAAKAFFRKVIKGSGHPIKVNIDKSGANTSALNSINEPLIKEEKIEIRQNKYLNNLVEQDHRFIKKRTRPMLGFKSFSSAANTIKGIELLHMIKKGQLNDNNNYKSDFDKFLSLAA
jgi:putative transposase